MDSFGFLLITGVLQFIFIQVRRNYFSFLIFLLLSVLEPRDLPVREGTLYLYKLQAIPLSYNQKGPQWNPMGLGLDSIEGLSTYISESKKLDQVFFQLNQLSKLVWDVDYTRLKKRKLTP